MAKIPGEVVFKPPRPPVNKPVVGPQNVGLPTYRPGDVNNPFGQLAPPPGPLTTTNLPAYHPPVLPPPPPPDFNALTLADPQYTIGKQNLEAQNQITLEGLLKGFRQTAQGRQDNANAHGALFSGAAVNAQRGAAQDYADQQRQQALNYGSASSSLYFDVFNRLKQMLAGGGA